jgi:hypothetical protein
MPSSVYCIQTSFLLHSKHAYSSPKRCWRGKGRFRHKKGSNKTRFSPPPLHFAVSWWPSTQASLRPQSGPQTPGILPSLPLLCLFDPILKENDSLKKKMDLNSIKHPRDEAAGARLGCG